MKKKYQNQKHLIYKIISRLFLRVLIVVTVVLWCGLDIKGRLERYYGI